MSLRIRRGTEAQRYNPSGPSGIIFDMGEIVYTTDSKKLYIGDGVTPGGINVLANMAGTNVTYNSTTNQLDFSPSGITTSTVGEGTNKYFTTQRAQDAFGALLAAGTQTGITMTYDSVNHQLNVSVGDIDNYITSLSSDPAPALGANLVLSGHNITGNGNININGTLSATGLGADLPLNSHSITGSGSINITGTLSTTSANPSVFKTTNTSVFELYSITPGGLSGTPSINLHASKGTLTSPTDTAPGDALIGINLQGYANGNYQTASALIAQWDPSAVMTDPLPASNFVIVTSNGTGPNYFTFNSQGVSAAAAFSAGDGSAAHPSLRFTTDGGQDSGFFHPGDGIVCLSVNAVEKVRVDSGGMRVQGFMKVGQVNGTLPSPPEEGMIVLDGTTFKGYTSGGWVNLN